MHQPTDEPDRKGQEAADDAAHDVLRHEGIPDLEQAIDNDCLIINVVQVVELLSPDGDPIVGIHVKGQPSIAQVLGLIELAKEDLLATHHRPGRFI